LLLDASYKIRIVRGAVVVVVEAVVVVLTHVIVVEAVVRLSVAHTQAATPFSRKCCADFSHDATNAAIVCTGVDHERLSAAVDDAQRWHTDTHEVTATQE
jgi:hypothetical protein